MKKRQFPKMVNGVLEYIFDAPLHGTMCRIRAEFLEYAIKKGVKMKIIIPGLGSGIIDPVECYRTGKRHAQVFRDPSRPMRLIDVYVPIPGVAPAMSKNEAKKMAKREQEKIKAALPRLF